MRAHLWMVAVALAPAVSNAETYYVATDGSDDAAGTEAAPWQSLQHAADEVKAGDTVIVRPGDYQGFQLETSGTEAAGIVFKGDAGANITGDNPSTPDGINLEGASFVTVEGFTVTGASRTGIRAVLCEHVTIRGNKADMNGRWGIITGFCDDLLIENNECSRSADEHGIYVSNSGDRPIVRNNIMWGNNANGLHMNGDASAGGDGVISGALVEGNVIYDNGSAGGSGINGDGVADSVIRNNLLYDNHASGISLYSIDGGAPSTNNLVINNTIVMAADARWAVNIQDASTGNKLRNNILLHKGSRGAVDLCGPCMSGFESDFNVVTGTFTLDDQQINLNTWKTMTGGDGSSMAAGEGELFVAPATADYSLLATAPAVDHGSTTDALNVDLAGNGRPQGSGIDIGALERCEGPCKQPPTGGGDGDGDGEGGGCCGAGHGLGSGALAPLVLGLLARRRRRAHSKNV
ncbi:MAG: right-handed parallel beta-helix repeat-containing protein [Kofleriaceae bacterium]